jgi:RNA polymerase sigma-B factor
VPDSSELPACGTALDCLPDAELLVLYRGPDGAEKDAACDVLVRRYAPLVRACVRPYRNSPESADDLMQVGFVGLMKAIRRFDPAFGNELRAYASPCISGEIKRHFRDKRWQVRVTRPLQELVLEMRGAAEALVQELGRQPDDAELAARLGVTAEDLNQARQAAEGLSSLSLDAPAGTAEDSAGLGELMGADDAAIEQAIGMQAIERHWDELSHREQQILLLRFYGNHTQQEVADKLGLSQMHISRLQARALAYLREQLSDKVTASQAT